MKKEETITRKEAEEMCKQIVESFKKTAFNEIKVLHSLLYDHAVSENEFEAIWSMTGDYLKTIMEHTEGIFGDLEGGLYLPKKAAEVTT